MTRETIVHPKGGEGCEIYATLSAVNKTILVTDEGEHLDKLIIKHLGGAAPILGRVKIEVQRIE